MADIIVLAELDGGAVSDISRQCLTVARGLAAGGKVVGVVAGGGSRGPAAQLFGLGADEVFAADDGRLGGYAARPYLAALAGWVRGRGAAAVLCPGSTSGNDFAPSLAASLGAGCALMCDRVEPRDGRLVFRRAEFDRKVMTSYAAAGGRPIVASLRDGAAEPAALDPSRTGAVADIPVTLDAAALTSKVLTRDVAAKTVNLKGAKIIVSAGAGVGSADGLKVVRELAETLGAQIGATRAVVDAGWLPADHQVGQTGSTVRPDVYIACGISGAVQHRVGMMDAGKIVAVNTDPNAPIFRIAHYRIVGDLKVVVPKLVKLLKS
jgi:electron transfer flavoprotein alpha subunit